MNHLDNFELNNILSFTTLGTLVKIYCLNNHIRKYSEHAMMIKDICGFLDIDEKITISAVYRDYRDVTGDEPLTEIAKFDLTSSKLNDNIIDEDLEPHELQYMYDNIKSCTLYKVMKMHPVIIFVFGCILCSNRLILAVIHHLYAPDIINGHAYLDSLRHRKAWRIAAMLREYMMSTSYWNYMERDAITDYFNELE
jgi:hypothetical protein